MRTDRCFLIAMAALAAPSVAVAQAGPKAISSASASVEIVAQQPLTLGEDVMLVFGLVKGGAIDGTVLIKPEGIRTPGGGAEIVGSGLCHTVYCEDETSPSNPDSASYWGPGKFAVTGAPNASYRITIGGEALADWRTPANGRIPQLTATNFTYICLNTGGSNCVLDGQGNDSVRVGGTLLVPPNMKTASYRVHVPISVQYY